MNFQGRLTRPDGVPVPDGTYALQLSLHTGLEAGVPLWRQSFPSVAVKNGIFSVLLDFQSGYLNNANLLTLFGHTFLFLEIKMGDAPPLSPRQMLASVAFAMKANSVRDASITTASLATQAVTMDKMGANSVAAVHIVNNSVDSARLISDPFSLSKVSGGLATIQNAQIGVGTAPLSRLTVQAAQPGDGISVTGNSLTPPGFLLFHSATLGGDLGLATASGHFSASARAGDVILRSARGNVLIQRGSGESAIKVTQFNTVSIRYPAGQGELVNFPLSVNGGIWAEGDVVSRGTILLSDARYKTNVQTFRDALDRIDALRGVTFDWNRDAFPAKDFPQGTQIGFIAQEVERVLPELVRTQESGYKAVLYQNVVPILVEAVKALRKQQDTALHALLKKNADLEARIQQMENQQSQIDALRRRLDLLLANQK
jgi:hypothetical protein